MITEDYQRLFEACMLSVCDAERTAEEKCEQFEFVIDVFRPYLATTD